MCCTRLRFETKQAASKDTTWFFLFLFLLFLIWNYKAEYHTHNNHLPVWSVLYRDMSQALYRDMSQALYRDMPQALYTAISTLFPYSHKHNIQAYSATHFKYNKQQQLTVSPYSILWALNVGISFAYKNTLNLQLNLWVFFLFYVISSTSSCKENVINLSKHVMDLAIVHFHNVSVFCKNERYLCSIYMTWVVL